MATTDPATLLLRQFRLLITEGMSERGAYNFIKDHFPTLLDVVNARAKRTGLVPHVPIGHMSLYRFELMICGLHSHQIRGICIGQTDNGADVATCAVAKYPLHNFPVGNNVYQYGGQGGRIAQAHKLNLRVLDSQEMDAENLALLNCSLQDSRVRLVIGNINEPYVYQGLFQVTAMHQFATPEDRLVFEYVLIRDGGQH